MRLYTLRRRNIKFSGSGKFDKFNGFHSAVTVFTIRSSLLYETVTGSMNFETQLIYYLFF